MPRDLRGTPKEKELFEALGDLHNPTAQLFSDLFARHKDAPEKYRTDDLINIGPAQSKFVKPNSTTTVGIYIVNKFLLEPVEVLGYVNKTFDDKNWGKVEDTIAAALLAGDITQETASRFIDRTQFLLGGPLAHIINPSITKAITELPPSAAALKKKLLKDHEAELRANNPTVAAKIEKEVTAEAMRVMEEKNDPAMGFFESGAIDPYNNYKTMFVMKGAIKDNTGESPTGYKIVTSNYNEGIAKKDMPTIADSLVTSAYSKGVMTQDSGYDGKKLNVLFQAIKLQPQGSDCGTKQYLKTVITNRHLYRYIFENGKLILLDQSNIDKYKGKVCNLRTPLHCHAPDPEYCSVCVGQRPYRVGIHNIGLTFNIISGATLNASMKAFHDIRVKTYNVTDDDLLRYVKV